MAFVGSDYKSAGRALQWGSAVTQQRKRQIKNSSLFVKNIIYLTKGWEKSAMTIKVTSHDAEHGYCLSWFVSRASVITGQKVTQYSRYLPYLSLQPGLRFQFLFGHKSSVD